MSCKRDFERIRRTVQDLFFSVEARIEECQAPAITEAVKCMQEEWWDNSSRRMARFREEMARTAGSCTTVRVSTHPPGEIKDL